MFTIKKAFKWSPNGYDVEIVEAGEHEELPERAMEVAKELGFFSDPAAEAEAKAKADKKADKSAAKKSK